MCNHGQLSKELMTAQRYFSQFVRENDNTRTPFRPIILSFNPFPCLCLGQKTTVNNFTAIINTCQQYRNNCERFEPRSHFKSRLNLIVRVNVVLNRTVVVDSD